MKGAVVLIVKAHAGLFVGAGIMAVNAACVVLADIGWPLDQAREMFWMMTGSVTSRKPSRWP